jgi:hypothetical protein
MNRWQKIAWYNLAVVSIASLLSLVTFGILIIVIGLPHAWGAFGWMGLLGFLGLTPKLFRKKDCSVEFDERDRVIQLKSVSTGFTASYLFLVAAGMGLWFYKGPNGTVSVNVLPNMILGAWIITVAIQSIVTLVGYGREVKVNE